MRLMDVLYLLWTLFRWHVLHHCLQGTRPQGDTVNNLTNLLVLSSHGSRRRRRRHPHPFHLVFILPTSQPTRYALPIHILPHHQPASTTTPQLPSPNPSFPLKTTTSFLHPKTAPYAVLKSRQPSPSPTIALHAARPPSPSSPTTLSPMAPFQPNSAVTTKSPFSPSPSITTPSSPSVSPPPLSRIHVYQGGTPSPSPSFPPVNALTALHPRTRRLDPLLETLDLVSAIQSGVATFLPLEPCFSR
ncbi:hypothetical protein BC829DRAFT_50142 [Chytridium lagenaria]|nr:hypothetical protein BC829DRAFT_50142 [Chytridium lagenaria]